MHILHKVLEDSFLNQAYKSLGTVGAVLLTVAITFVAFVLSHDGLTQFLEAQSVSGASLIAALLTITALGVGLYGHIHKSNTLTILGHGVNYIFAVLALIVGGLGSSYTAGQAAGTANTNAAVAEELAVQLNDLAGLQAWARAQPTIAPEQSKFDALVYAKRTAKGALIWEVTNNCTRPSMHVKDCSILSATSYKLQASIASAVELRKEQLRAQLSDARSAAPGANTKPSTALMMEVQRLAAANVIGWLIALAGLFVASFVEVLLYAVLFILTKQTTHHEVVDTQASVAVDIPAPKATTKLDHQWLLSQGFNGEWAQKALLLLGTYQAGAQIKLLPSFKLLKTSREKLIASVLEPLEALGFVDTSDENGVKTYTWTVAPLEDLL